MLKRFGYHGVTVGDLERSIVFYRDLLHMKLEKSYEVTGEGLEEATGFPGAHTKVAFLSYGGHLLKLTQYLFPEGKKSFEARICDVGASHVTIHVEMGKVPETYDELCAKGVKFMSPPVHRYPVEHPERALTYMLDPDGCMVQLTCRGGISIHHHAHAVIDEDRAVAFYRDVLGMKTGRIRDITGKAIEEATGLPGVHDRETDMLLDGDEAIEFQNFVNIQGKKKAEIRLCDVGCSCVAFEVDDVQQAYEEFRAKGAKFISSPVHLIAEGPEVTMVYMLDPDDYVLELRSG